MYFWLVANECIYLKSPLLSCCRLAPKRVVKKCGEVIQKCENCTKENTTTNTADEQCMFLIEELKKRFNSQL